MENRSMSETVERYPLSWPVGWKRTGYGQRRHAAFHATKTVYSNYVNANGQRSSWKQKESLSVGKGLERLNGELKRLGAQRIVISSNLRIREDGLPYAQQAKQLDDPGVAVYFYLKNQPRVLACDKWLSAAENMAAIAGHIAAIRAQDRYGVGTLDQAFAGYAAIPAKTGGEDWRAEMGFKPDEHPDSEAIEARFRALARERHPDAGGSHEAMARLNQARASAMQEQLVGAR
jgi:hypothetical protein